MNRAAMLREVRMESFERMYGLWCRKRMTQAAAARALAVTARTFRRWVARYEAGGLSALRDRRVGCSGRRAPPEEVEAVEALYEVGHRDWNVRHFYDEVYVAEHGGRSVVHLGEEPASGSGAGEEGAEEGPAPGAAGAEAGGRADASPGRFETPVGAGRVVGSGRDDGRRDGRGLRGDLGDGGRDVVEPSGSVGDGGGEGTVRQPVCGPRLTLLAHAGGGREGGQGQPDPVRAGDGGAGDRDDCRVLAAGAGPERAAVRDAPGATAAGAGAGGDHRDGCGERVPEGLLATLQRGVHGGAEGAGERVLAPWCRRFRRSFPTSSA